MNPTPQTGSTHTSKRREPARRWGTTLVSLAVLATALVATGCTGGGTTANPTLTMPTINLPSRTDPTIHVSIDPPSIKLPTLPKESSESKSTEAHPSTTPASNNNSAGSSPWLWIILAGVAVAGIIAAITSARRRRDYVNTLISDIISRGQWVVDHGTDALVGAPTSAAAQQAWSQLDGALVDLTADVTKLDGRVKGDQAQQVREVRDATSALRLAAETDARARLTGGTATTPDGTAPAASPATDALFDARRRLATAIAVLNPNAPAEQTPPPHAPTTT